MVDMKRFDVINILSKYIKAKSYLEIGVDAGYNFQKIDIPQKTGVDPNKKSKATCFLSSDEFFKINKQKFDIIFIDGLHTSDQIEKDIFNSLDILNPKGYIVCHDILPKNKKMQIVPRIQKEWTGDVWKTWVKIRSIRHNLEMFVVDCDYGCGVIKYGEQNIIDIKYDLTFENFLIHKKYWMHIINPTTFKNKYA